MSEPLGATILIIFYLLRLKNMVKKEFLAEQLVQLYSTLKQNEQHQLYFDFFLDNYKKREDKSELDVFTSAAKLRGWLKKHSGKLSRTWFTHQGDVFTLIPECVEELQSYMNLPALLVERHSVTVDETIHTTAKGYRKVIVTDLYERERAASSTVWRAPVGDEDCPVLVMDSSEAAVFTHHAKQDRHYHRLATEIYMVIEGQMTVEVAEEIFILSAGDMIVVRPLAIHKVMKTTKFLARVITLNCRGQKDKYLARNAGAGNLC